MLGRHSAEDVQTFPGQESIKDERKREQPLDIVCGYDALDMSYFTTGCCQVLESIIPELYSSMSHYTISTKTNNNNKTYLNQ